MVVRPPGRRGPNRTRFVVMLVGLVVVGTGIVYGIHWLGHPWALALPGKPALTGYWQGDVPYGSGDERHIVLHLTDDPPSAHDRCTTCPALSGTATVCAGDRAERYELWGNPLNYLGSRFSLHTRSEAEGPGPRLNELHGEWEGDVIRVRTSLTRLDAAGATVGSDSPPTTFEMSRADEAAFDAACR
ncbi:hypothetical protein [Micromonospora globbae]|uniref:hypothetical protein n=1 Tax=Micromonospora globbae TaxID=1894969 RepID=UPI00378A163B